MLRIKLAFAAPERVYFRMRLKTALLVVFPVVAAGGCAAVGPFDEPYALFETGLRSAVRKELPVIINSVDGKYYRDPRRPGPFKPGKHVLEVHFTTALGPSWKHRKTVEIDRPGNGTMSSTRPPIEVGASLRRWATRSHTHHNDGRPRVDVGVSLVSRLVSNAW